MLERVTGTVCPTAGTEMVISPVSVPCAETRTPPSEIRWVPLRVPEAVISSSWSPWTRFPERQGVERGDYPNFVRWFDGIAERPAVQRGVEVLADRRRDLKTDKAAWEIMFGATQYQRR